MMERGLNVSYLWHDFAALEVRISASNGEFAGVAEPYTDLQAITDAAAKLEGFPVNAQDVRDLEFGAPGEEFAGGYGRLRFFCVDLAGHAAVEIWIATKEGYRASSGREIPAQSVHMIARIEAAAIDDFVRELRELNENFRGSADLRFAN